MESIAIRETLTDLLESAFLPKLRILYWKSYDIFSEDGDGKKCFQVTEGLCKAFWKKAAGQPEKQFFVSIAKFFDVILESDNVLLREMPRNVFLKHVYWY